MIGTVRKNKPELPPQLLTTKSRPVNSYKFVFTADTSLVYYVPKKGKNVVIITKTEIIMDYNGTKGGLDNMDKLVTGYSCKRRTLRCPLVISFNIMDNSAYNAFVIWVA